MAEERKYNIGEEYEEEYYFCTIFGIHGHCYCCRFLHALESNSNSYIVGSVFCGYIGGKTKCVKMNETLNQWKAL